MEGPSIVILREQAQPFEGKPVLRVQGNSKIDQQRISNQHVMKFKSWGKHFLIGFSGFYLRVHFLMFGSYRINETKQATPRLSLQFDNGEINLYSCGLKLVDEEMDKGYDWDVDVLSETWKPLKAKKALQKNASTMVCDALLDQDIFAGVGNIIKNEVLYRIKVHPETKIESLPPAKLNALIREARNYSFDFYHWKKKFELKKHWLIYNKKKCLSCKLPVHKIYSGNLKRRSFVCNACQRLY
ncbi:MAG: DNA-formamidopyrimidine glycosylase family protein [Chitinophagaceae bacterium]